MRNKTKFGELTQAEIDILKANQCVGGSMLAKVIEHVIELAETEVEYHLSDATIKQLAEIIDNAKAADNLSAESVAKNLVDEVMKRCKPQFEGFVRDTCEELRNIGEKLKVKSASKEELSNYARENRERLKKQEVKLGDIVEVLIGEFAGERGIVKQIIACGNDYDDPYYCLEMQCEVPEKYRMYPDNPFNKGIIGGLSNYEFEIIGHAKSTAEILQAEKELEKRKIEELEKMNNPKPHISEITIPIRAEFDDSVYDAYRMVLAKEVAVALIAKGHNIAFVDESAVLIANGIVRRLKTSKTE